MTLSPSRRLLVLAAAVCLLCAGPAVAFADPSSDPSTDPTTTVDPSSAVDPSTDQSTEPTAPGTSSAAPPPQQRCAHSEVAYTQRREWAGELTDPQRVWPMADGTGTLVAVLSTGVDPDNPQLERSRLQPPQVDLVPGSPADCVGRGTFAAGIVAAAPAPSTTFTGLAPGAHILSMRVTQSTSETGDGTSPDVLAVAITAAASAHADVILVNEPAKVDSPALEAAVRHAVDVGSVVVSPAAAQRNGQSFPTTNPLVLSVGAVDSNGQPTGTEEGDYIDVAAPGTGLVSTAAGAHGKVAHNWPVESPNFAAAFVAGTVALLRSYRHDLTPQQVENRITLTASRSGGHDPYRGWGVLDTYAAVASELPADAPGPQAAQPFAPQQRIAPAPGPAEVEHNRAGGLAAVLGLLGLGTALAATATIRRGRAFGWRPSRFR